MVGKHIATDIHDGVTVVAARDGLFDAMPETDDSAPVAAEVGAEFRSAVAGAGSVVIDFRRAGEVNKRTLNVSFQLAHALTDIGARRALCGAADLEQIWNLCRSRSSPDCHAAQGHGGGLCSHRHAPSHERIDQPNPSSTMKHTRQLIHAFFLATLLAAPGATAAAKPLKVFILAGQSNMEGPASIKTFDYIGDDPATAPLLKLMRGADEKPTVCDHTWISYLTGDGEKNFEITGKLTAGYGSMWGLDSKKPGDKIGPEFTFGFTMDAALAEPVLIIKAAWGGKSLHTDFRSPSAGPYELSSFQRENYPKQTGHGIPKDFEQWKADKAKATGRYYRLMIEHVKKVLADPKRVYPDYDAAQGFELAGFVWLQGFNDMVDGHVYPNHNTPNRFDLYSELLAHFVRDVRKDLTAPNLPFVIGVMGVGGLKDESVDMVAFRRAMAAPAAMPEFKRSVVAVQTAPFWSDELAAIDKKHEKVGQMRYFLDAKHKDHANADGKMTEEQKREFVKKFEADLITPAETALWKRGASNAGYHYLGCAKTFALMGKSFAEANLKMLESGRH